MHDDLIRKPKEIFKFNHIWFSDLKFYSDKNKIQPIFILFYFILNFILIHFYNTKKTNNKQINKYPTLEQSTVPPRSIFSINHLKISISQRKKIIVCETLQLWVKEDLHEVRNSDVILDFGQTMKFDVKKKKQQT